MERLFVLFDFCILLKNYYIHFYKVISFNGHFGGYETRKRFMDASNDSFKNIKNHESLLSD